MIFSFLCPAAVCQLTVWFARRRMTCEQALAHPWMAAFDSGELETKNLSKEKMKKYLARQKWKVTPQCTVFMSSIHVSGTFLFPDFFIVD